MEILIPGLILVGFMVWASTRIKRNAARAFEEEEIETEEFTLVKPEGLLSKVDPPDGKLFFAYSKDYGIGDDEGLRKATAEIIRIDAASIDEVREAAKENITALVAEQTGIIDGRKCANIVVERLSQGAAVETTHKIIANGSSVYQLSVSVLAGVKAELSSTVDGLVDSFALK